MQNYEKFQNLIIYFINLFQNLIFCSGKTFQFLGFHVVPFHFLWYVPAMRLIDDGINLLLRVNIYIVTQIFYASISKNTEIIIINLSKKYVFLSVFESTSILPKMMKANAREN